MNRMKNSALFLILLFFSLSLKAQETAPSFLLYAYNMNMLNPAYAGSTEQSEINVGFRRQSLDLQDDPITQYLSYSKALKNNLGIGISFVNDKVFISRQTDVVIDVSYKLQVAKATHLYFGLKAGGAFYAIDFNSLGVEDPLFSANENTFSPTLGVGTYLKGERYFVHLSVPNLILSDVQKPKLDNNGQVLSESVQEKLHLYFGGGYRFTASESITVTPSVFSRFVTDEDMLLDATVTADFSKKVEAGLTYRLDTSIIGSVLLKLIDNTYFGYAYEAPTSDYSGIAAGAHEFVVRFKF